jgi:hypothetical protein
LDQDQLTIPDWHVHTMIKRRYTIFGLHIYHGGYMSVRYVSHDLIFFSLYHWMDPFPCIWKVSVVLCRWRTTLSPWYWRVYTKPFVPLPSNSSLLKLHYVMGSLGLSLLSSFCNTFCSFHEITLVLVNQSSLNFKTKFCGTE